MQDSWRPSTEPIGPGEIAGLAGPGLVAIHAWAAWNLHDRAFDERLRLIRPEFEGRVEFYSLDVDTVEDPGFRRSYRVGNVPALIGLARGEWVGTIVGCHEADELRARIVGWLGGQREGRRPRSG